MGYRLSIKDPKTGELIHDSKLYGYITDDEMRSCRSLQWLIENHKLDDYEDPYTCWDYGFEHEMYLNHSDVIEFIVRCLSI